MRPLEKEIVLRNEESAGYILSKYKDSNGWGLWGDLVSLYPCVFCSVGESTRSQSF